jgi:hypothetical protein
LATAAFICLGEVFLIYSSACSSDLAQMVVTMQSPKGILGN